MNRIKALTADGKRVKLPKRMAMVSMVEVDCYDAQYPLTFCNRLQPALRPLSFRRRMVAALYASADTARPVDSTLVMTDNLRYVDAEIRKVVAASVNGDARWSAL